MYFEVSSKRHIKTIMLKLGVLGKQQADLHCTHFLQMLFSCNKVGEVGEYYNFCVVGEYHLSKIWGGYICLRLSRKVRERVMLLTRWEMWDIS